MVTYLPSGNSMIEMCAILVVGIHHYMGLLKICKHEYLSNLTTLNERNVKRKIQMAISYSIQ